MSSSGLKVICEFNKGINEQSKNPRRIILKFKFSENLNKL